MNRLLLFAIFALAAQWTLAQSTIVHTSGRVYADPWFFSTSASVDMNQDGVEDLSLSADPWFCTADVPTSYCNQTLYIGIPSTSAVLVQGNYAASIPIGEWIGMSGPSNTAWSTHYIASLMTYWRSPRYGTSGVRGPIGEQGQGYFGVRFSAADGEHYGWVFVQGQILVEWAYELRPNQPIRAGAKPIPAPLSHAMIERPGHLRIVAETENGKAYQVQFKDSLLDFSWSNLSFALPASGPSISVDLPLTERRAFYRIVEAD